MDQSDRVVEQPNSQARPPVAFDILNNIRVIDVSTGIAGAYATKLFADAGADVVKVETTRHENVQLAWWYGRNADRRDSALYRFLNGAKRSIRGSLDDDAVQALVASADMLVTSALAPQIDVEYLRERYPRLVVLSLTPWGTRGPWTHRPATEFIVQAESGAIGAHGHPDEVPYQMGGRITEWCAGTFGAVGALAAVSRAQDTGRGELVECSLQAASAYASTVMLDSVQALIDEPISGTPARFVDLPSIEPSFDGYVGFKIHTRAQFESFLILIERADLLSHPDWPMASYRKQRRAEWDRMVQAWTTQHATAEIIARASALRIPVTTVNDAEGVLANEHFRARGMFIESPDGSFVHPAPPYRIDGHRPSIRNSAPKSGEHTGRVESRSPSARLQVCANETELPFVGLRVLDATQFWAGPSVGQIFAYLGADVIHLESMGHPDGARTQLRPEFVDRDQWWEWSATYLTNNVNKRDLVLSLDDPAGLEIAKRLIATCDVVVENFTPRVFDNFGLDEAVMRELNPKVVFARMPAFGLDGPWRDRTGFAQTMEQATGMAWRTGQAASPPRILNGPCDPLAGYHSAFAIMLALHRRTKTGIGALVEAAMAEAALNVAAEMVVEYTANGTLLAREGNRSPDAAPQGVYQCAGTERWLAVSIVDEQHWAALKEVMGRPDWAERSLFGTIEGRQSEHDFIDRHINDWVSDKQLDDLVQALIERGVPAGEVVDPRLMAAHPQLCAYGYYEETTHPVVGSRRLATVPFRFGSVARWGRTPSPLLGEHNHEILGDLLGLDEGQIADLQVRRVVGSRPTGA